jgi:hypothetical protein
VTDEARERWREKHRAKRVRDKKWGPAIGLGKAVAFWLVLALSLGVLAVTLFVAWGWGILAFALFYLALRIKGIRPFEGGGSDTYGGYHGGGSGGDGGGLL